MLRLEDKEFTIIIFSTIVIAIAVLFVILFLFDKSLSVALGLYNDSDGVLVAGSSFFSNPIDAMKGWVGGIFSVFSIIILRLFGS